MNVKSTSVTIHSSYMYSEFSPSNIRAPNQNYPSLNATHASEKTKTV